MTYQRRIDRTSLACASVLVLGLVGFALLIVLAKQALSAPVFGDVSAYLLLIVGLALGIWALTWLYMAVAAGGTDDAPHGAEAP